MGCTDCYSTQVCPACINAELQVQYYRQYQAPINLERKINVSSGEDAFVGDVYVSEELAAG